MIILFACRQTHSVANNKDVQPDPILGQRITDFSKNIYPDILDSVRSGDLVTRMGRDITSMLLSGFNKHDSSFSHCGIVNIENDTPFVYHCIGGEFNPDQKMKREPIFMFAAPENSKRIGLYQPLLSKDEIQSLVTIVKGWFAAGLPFDMDFNLATDNRMYCAEMVSKALAGATGNRCRIETRKIDSTVFIPVENTFLNPWMKEKLQLAY